MIPAHIGRISNPTGTIRSAVIDLDVVAAPIITSAPASIRVANGRTAVFNVLASGGSAIWLSMV